MGYGLDKLQLKQVIQTFVLKEQKVTPFKNNMPGDDWISG